MSNVKPCVIALLLIFVLSQQTVRADFPPPVKAALATVSGEQSQTMELASEAHSRARSIENAAFPTTLPESVPEYHFCKEISLANFDDMRSGYNSILDSIRNGTATEDAIRSSTHESVFLNNAFIDSARKCLKRNDLEDFSESTIANAWIQILNSYKTMKDNDKKKLSKHLDKKLRWKTTRPSGF